MISERLSGIYTALEEKYYGLLDFLGEKGIPVYGYNDFLEEKGLPGFPITVALIVLLVAVLYGLVFVGGAVNPEISFTFSDQFGDSVSGVTVTVRDGAGNLVASPEKVSNGGSLTLEGIPLGTELALVAEKHGFRTEEQIVTVAKARVSTAITMQREIEAIVGKIQLLDSETNDPIRNAVVTAEWKGTTKSEITDSGGKASFAGIPANTEILVTIQADGYETLKQNYSFQDGETKGISLVGSTASLSGTSKLVVSVLDEEGNLVKGAKAIVWDRETDTSIEERTLVGSETVFSISKKTSVRLIVQKEGFLKYDSLDFEESRTMRQDEEQWPVVLEKGGTRLIATVFSGQTPLGDATVQLFDLNGNSLGLEVTGFGGTVEFRGLSPKEFFVTAYKQGFLPARDKVNVAETETMSLVVEAADSSNSSYLGISVLDSYKAMANNAGLVFKEKIAGQLLPLGIPQLKTDVSGYASITAKTGTLIAVEAQKDMQVGFGEKLVEANKDNQLVIELSKPIDVLELQVFDQAGNPATGNVEIESVTGELLFSGPISEGSVFFDSEGNKEAIVRVETSEGETFSQRVLVEGKETVQVNLGEAAVGIAPTITFTGIFDEYGEATEGILAGKDYWLGFQATWPTGVEKGGIHIRLGMDGIAFVDSQEAGITGFSATTASYFYGKSYQPLPSPGNETADRQNVGIAGEKNKLLELYFEQPENTISLKARVRANQSTNAREIEAHYRAWSEAGGKFFRTPLDSELGEELFSETKTSLYAATEKATVKVFASAASCEEELCGNYFFVQANGLYVDRQEFVAVTEELYALEIDLSAKKPLNVTLKLDTDKVSPKIQFTGYDVDDFVDQQEQEPLSPDTLLSGQGYLEWAEGSEELQSGSNPLGFGQGSGTTSITVTGLGVSPERSRKVRAYFKAIGEGKAEIKMQAASETVLNESFVFQVERNRPLMVTVSPREVEIGEPFTVRVLDGETGEEIQNATVQVRDSRGNLVESKTGSGSSRRGLNGEYYFKNSLDPGFYKVMVSAAGFKGEEFELSIANNNLLSVVGPIAIGIPGGSREKTFTFSIRNDAKQEVLDIGYELGKEPGFPAEFAVSVTLPASISEKQDVTATIRVIVNLNEESKESLYGEANLVLKGMVAGTFPTKTSVKLKISYNKPLDQDCLYFDKEQLKVVLMGSAGSNATEEFEVENRCGTALDLRASVETMQQDPNLTVSVSPLRLEKGAVEKVKVSISNRIERMYDLQSRRDYTIKFESSQITKTIPLTVEIWNPQTNLSYPPSIALWMVRSAAEELAYAQAPIQIMNKGAIPITAFRANPTVEAYVMGIQVGMKPSDVTGVTLYPNMPLTPQRFVYAETKQTEAMQKPGQGYIQFSGVAGGRMYELGKTSLGINYSGIKCLEAKAVDDMYFSSKEAGEGTLERAVIITNKCGEPVRLTGSLLPAKVRGNSFVLSPPLTLAPGQQQQVNLILMKSQETNTTAAVKVVGLLTMQNKWIESNEISVTIKLGELEATSEGKRTAEKALKNCNTGEMKNIAFPLLSSDCGNGYCDAKQLAEYIVEKMDSLVKTAKDKANRANRNAAEFSNCASKSYCSFERDMGIINERFPVFLQLDSMTEEVLEKALEDSKQLKGYIVLQGEKSVEDIGKAGFDFGQVHLGGQFKGCGKYYVKLVGAIRVDNQEINTSGEKNFMLSVNADIKRANTAECLHRAENISNFLPRDEGYTITQNYHAWPGFVKSRPGFELLAKEFAKELFGTAEGRQGSTLTATSNHLEIVVGNTENGLLKMRIGKTGKPDQPKTVYAHVPANYAKENKQMTSEITKALATFKRNGFSDEDCWGIDDQGNQYIVMRSYSDVDKLYGKLVIEGMDAIRINKQEKCIDLNISSKAPEEIMFSTDFVVEGKVVPKPGIEYVAIKDSRGNVLLQQFANGKQEPKNGSLKLEKDKSKPDTTVYRAEFQFCVKGDSMFPLAVENVKSISITGISPESTKELGRKTKPHEVSIEACGMHPYDLVKKMSGVELKDIEDKEEKKLVAYFTVNWKDGPEKISIGEINRAIAAEAAMDKAKKKYGAGENVAVAEQPAYMAEMAWKRLRATWIGYVVPCSAAALALNWWTFGVKGGWDIGITCIAPAAWASKGILKDMGGQAKQGTEFIEGVVSTIVEWIPFVGKPLANLISPEPSTVPSDIPTEEQALEDAKNTRNELLAEAITGVTFRDITRSISIPNSIISSASATVAGSEAADTILQQMMKTTLKGVKGAELEILLGGKYVGSKFVPAEVEGLRKTFAGNIKDNLMLHSGKAKIKDKLLESVTDAYGKTGKDLTTMLATNIDNLPQGLQNQWVSSQQAYLDKILSTEGVGGPDIEKTLVTMEDADIKSFQTANRANWKANVRSTIKRKLDRTAEGKKLLQGGIMDDVDEIIKGKGLSYSKTTKTVQITQPAFGVQAKTGVEKTVRLTTDLDRLSIEVIDEAREKVGKKMVEGIIGKEAADDFAKNMFSGADDLIDPKKIRSSTTRGYRFRQAIRNFFSRQFWNWDNLKAVGRNLFKGAAIGFAEIYAGMVGHSQYWEHFEKEPVPGAEKAFVTPDKVTDVDGDGEITEADYQSFASQELWKGETYRLQIMADPDGKIYRFTRMKDEEDFEQMNKDLEEGKAELWEEEGCKNFMQKTVGKYLGNLAPVPEKGVDQGHVIAYYNHNSLFAGEARGDKDNVADDLKEERLVAVLFVQPDRIKGCSIPNEWYKRGKDEAPESSKARAKSSIECAAKELRKAGGSEGANKTFKSIVEELAKGQDKILTYVDQAVQMHRKWEKFRIVRAS